MGDANETAVSLREHFESRLVAVEKATDRASSQLEKRLEGMNEFRGQLRDQAETFLPRSEYVLMHDRLVGEVRTLSDYRVKMDSKADQKTVTFATGIAVLSAILAMCAFGLALVDFVLRKGRP